jgi:hypothetical protein
VSFICWGVEEREKREKRREQREEGERKAFFFFSKKARTSTREKSKTTHALGHQREELGKVDGPGAVGVDLLDHFL